MGSSWIWYLGLSVGVGSWPRGGGRLRKSPVVAHAQKPQVDKSKEAVAQAQRPRAEDIDVGVPIVLLSLLHRCDF